MGCSKSSEQMPQGTLLEQYHAAGLQQPWSGEFENDFEKQIYMGINMCRHDPKRFVPHVRKVYRDNILLSAGKGKKMNELIAKLQATAPLGQVKFDEQANQACRQNNAAVIERNEEAPALGGNIAKYSELTGGDKSASCAEYTMVKFTGCTGEEFVALQLALDFEDFKGTQAKKEEAGQAATEAANKLDEAKPAAAASDEPDAAAVANTLDYGGVPNPTTAAATSAPDKGEADPASKKPATTADKKPATATAAAPAKPGYSPILDADVTCIGVCNKAHKKTQNVIQVLYVKSSTNSMM